MAGQACIKLSSGYDMPLVGLGTVLLDNPHIVEKAIQTGYRHIDCAYLYLNEKTIGEGLRAAIEKGVVKREDMFITGKLWATCFREDLVRPCLEETLRDLGTDYLDLFLIHMPMSLRQLDEYVAKDDPRHSPSMIVPKNEHGQLIEGDVSYMEPWRVMETCVREGLVRSIGVSNFNSVQLQDLVDQAEIKPAVNQFECHPFLSQVPLIGFCQKRNVAVTANCPLGGPEVVESPDFSTTIDRIHSNKTLMKIGKKYGKTAAQVALRFNVQRNVVVVPRTSKVQRLGENLAVFDFQLTEQEMDAVLALNQGARFESWEIFKDFKNFPYGIPF